MNTDNTGILREHSEKYDSVTKKMRRPKIGKIIFSTVLILIVLLNAVAIMHAWKMTHFAESGGSAKKPENMTASEKLKTLFTGVSLRKPKNEVTPRSVGLGYIPVNIMASDGVKLSAWYLPAINPTGTVVMFHGYVSCKSKLLPEAVMFHDMRWDVFLVDFRGSGESDGYSTTIGYDEALDVTAAYNWAKKEHGKKKVVLFGASMGSAAILRAIYHSMVAPDAVILECPYDRLLNTVKHRFELMNTPSFPAAQLLVFWGGVLHGYNAFRLNPAVYAAEVKCPALVLHGDRDPRVKPGEIQAVFTALKGPSHLHTFTNVAHESYCKANPAEYRRVISEWLK